MAALLVAVAAGCAEAPRRTEEATATATAVAQCQRALRDEQRREEQLARQLREERRLNEELQRKIDALVAIEREQRSRHGGE